jgi:CBS domain-containing protein
LIYVKDVMTRNVKTISEGQSVVDAARKMAKWKIGSLVIVHGGLPVDIITEGDISRSVAKGAGLKSTKVLSRKRKLMTVDPGERIEVAAKMMADAGVKKLPVMEGKKLVGMITQTDIVNSSFALVTSLKEMVQARYRPPDFEV